MTFAYEVAAAPLLESGRLARLAEGDFSITRPFTFVTLPDSPLARQEQYLFEHIRDLCARLRGIFKGRAKQGRGGLSRFGPNARTNVLPFQHGRAEM